MGHRLGPDVFGNVVAGRASAGQKALMGANDAAAQLDNNNPVFQEHLLNLQKPDRHAALDALKKIRPLTWAQLYQDNGLQWEKIIGVKPPAGIDAVYSMRITQARRCTAFREGEFLR